MLYIYKRGHFHKIRASSKHSETQAQGPKGRTAQPGKIFFLEQSLLIMYINVQHGTGWFSVSVHKNFINKKTIIQYTLFLHNKVSNLGVE